MAQGVPGSLRRRIFLTFGTTRVVGGQLYAPAAFTPEEIPGTHFLESESTPGHMVPSEPRKKSPVTPPGIDPGTVRLVAQCLNHYATPGPQHITLAYTHTQAFTAVGEEIPLSKCDHIHFQFTTQHSAQDQ